MHVGHVGEGDKVLLVDDLIATGGTMALGRAGAERGTTGREAVARSVRLAEREAEASGVGGGGGAGVGREPRTRLQALVGWFSQHLGGADEAARFLTSQPRLLRVNPVRLDANYKWLVGILREGGASEPGAAELEALRAVRRSPSAFELQLAEGQGPHSVVEFLRELGLKPPAIRRVCTISPSLLTQSPFHLRRKVDWLTQRLEALEDGAPAPLKPLPTVGKMVTRLPALLNYSLDNLGAKLDYLEAHLGEGGGDRPALAAHVRRMPACLAYSLTDRLAPRFAFCKALGVGAHQGEANSSPRRPSTGPFESPEYSFALSTLPESDAAFAKRANKGLPRSYKARKASQKAPQGDEEKKELLACMGARALWNYFQQVYCERLEGAGLETLLRGPPGELLEREAALAREALTVTHMAWTEEKDSDREGR